MKTQTNENIVKVFDKFTITKKESLLVLGGRPSPTARGTVSAVAEE